MSAIRQVTEADILPRAEYAKVRGERRRQIAQMKKLRRLEVGPHVTFYFESFATMRPGVIPWTNVTFSEAAAACGRGGMFLCERRVLRTLPRS